MYRRIIIITIILWSGILGISSCLKCDDVPPYWEITDFDIYLTDNNLNEYVSGIYESDTLRLGIEFSHEFLTQLFHPFINSTFATEMCPFPGDLGPKDPILSAIVISDKDFDDFQPGESLNTLLQIPPNPLYTIEECIIHLNSSTTLNSINLYFTNKPLQKVERTFTLTFTFESGKEIIKTTEPINWQ